MAFYTKPAFLIILVLIIIASGIGVTALPGLGNCAVVTIETTGLTRTVCNMGPLPSYSMFRETGSAWKPQHLIRDVRPLGAYGTSIKISQSKLKIGSQSNLTTRLCPDGRIPIATTDPNPEGKPVMIVKCLPKGSIVGQSGPTFLSTNTRLARWQELRDPYPYTQKQNRPFNKR